ncbi:MAG: MaoC/PaaZ C-terminal domain-containing protein [Myxococcota bacterium]
MTESTTLEFASLPSLSAAYRRALFCSKPGLGDGETIPKIEARVAEVRIEAQRLADYRRICGFVDSDHVPITYPQVLANAVHAEMVLAPTFPVKPWRIIHRGNTITSHRPLRADEPFALVGRVEGHRETQNGIEIDFFTNLEVDGETVWNSTSNVLIRRGKAAPGKKPPPKAVPGDEPSRWRSTIWKLPANAGRLYSAVANDYNPIHLYALTAKLFGFKRAIVHGLWSLARCVAELDHDLPGTPLTVEVQFKRPVYLPGTVLFTAGRREQGVEFALRTPDGAKPHLVGLATSVG